MQATPSLSFLEAIKTSTNRIKEFKGRSRRSEFWWSQLLVYLVSFVLTPIAGCLLGLFTNPLKFRRLHDTGRSGWWWGIGALLKLAFIVFLGHDLIMTVINSDNMDIFDYQLVMTFVLKYSLFSIAICIYQIVLIVLYCLDSEQIENIYGESPKYINNTNVNV